MKFGETNQSFQAEFEGAIPVSSVSDHSVLINRDLPDQHPMKAITNLDNELGKKLEGEGALSNQEIYQIMEGTTNGKIFRQ